MSDTLSLSVRDCKRNLTDGELPPLPPGETVPPVDIGQIISREMERLNVRPAELARRVGVSWQQIQKWQKQDTIKADRLLQIAIALDVPLSVFLGDEVRQLEQSGGVNERERELLDAIRELPSEDQAAVAKGVADQGARQLLRLYLALPEVGRKELIKAARKLAIDLEE